MTDTNENAPLFAAIAKAQAKIKGAIKDSTNPFFKSKYADLAACFEAVRGPFAEQGLAIVQLTHPDPLRVVTMIVHESGASIQDGGVPIKPTKDDPQGMGSGMTYARRYGLTAMAGLPQIDDDGNAASQPAPDRQKMSQKEARAFADLIDNADIESGEGVDAFGEAWIEIGQEAQLSFGPWISQFWPGGVSATKQKMRDIMAAYRERLNGEEAA